MYVTIYIQKLGNCPVIVMNMLIYISKQLSLENGKQRECK